MPQEFLVVRCFSCLFFQVDQVKKKPKWQCKVCSEKQSLKKVYGRGSGKECRLLVQSLNRTAGEQAQTEDDRVSSARSGGFVSASAPEQDGAGFDSLPYQDLAHELCEYEKDQPIISKWNQFCEDEASNTCEDDEDKESAIGIPSDLLTTERPVHMRRKRGFHKNAERYDSSRKQRKLESDWESTEHSTYARRDSPLPNHGPDYSDGQGHATDSQSWNHDRRASTSGRASEQIPGNGSFRYSQNLYSTGSKNSDTLNQGKAFASRGSSEFPCVDNDKSECSRRFHFTTKYNREQKAVTMAERTNPRHRSSGLAVPSASGSKWLKYADVGQDDEEESFGEGAQEFETVTENEYGTCEPGYGVNQNVDRVQPLQDRTGASSHSVHPNRQKNGPNNLDSGIAQSSIRASGSERTHIDMHIHVDGLNKNTNKSSGAGKYSHQSSASAVTAHSHIKPSHQSVLTEVSSVTSRTSMESLSSFEGRKDHQGQHETTVFQLPEEDLEHLPDDFDVW